MAIGKREAIKALEAGATISLDSQTPKSVKIEIDGKRHDLGIRTFHLLEPQLLLVQEVSGEKQLCLCPSSTITGSKVKVEKTSQGRLSTSGVYALVNTQTEEIYVGSTIETFRARINEHLKLLKGGIHSNKDLQESWREFPEEAFEFRILEEIQREDKVREREEFWARQCDPRKLLSQVSHVDRGRKYPQLVNRKTGRVIPTGRNLYCLCANLNLNFERMWNLVYANGRGVDGWNLDNSPQGFE